MKALWTAFLTSCEMRWMRTHAVLLMICGAVVAVILIAGLAVQ